MDPYKTDTDEFQQTQSIRSMEVAKNCLKKIAMLFVWAGPAAPGYCFVCAWDERRIQMSPATHHMSSMNPYKTHTDEFQQIQSIRSMEVASGQKTVSRKLPCFLCRVRKKLQL
jgi:hypothetical protein